MITQIIQAFWLFLPAGIANMAPVFFKKVPFLNKQINKELFGAHKTYRGFFFGILMALIIVQIQKLLYPYMATYSIIDYTTIDIFKLGFLLGFGALFGDLIESYFKRKKGIKPGKQWLLFDQLDWIIGANVFLLFYARIDLNIILISIVLFGTLHPLINYIGYLLKIKKSKF